MKALLRRTHESGQLGSHNGLPVTVIVSTTVQELEKRAGVALTGGGSLLPMPDLIRLAAAAHHYLYVFDGHTGQCLYLGRAKRLANAAQRIVLHARDRGCTRGRAAPCPVTGVRPTTRARTGKTTARPNGSHPPTSTPDNAASTATTTGERHLLPHDDAGEDEDSDDP